MTPLKIMNLNFYKISIKIKQKYIAVRTIIIQCLIVPVRSGVPYRTPFPFICKSTYLSCVDTKFSYLRIKFAFYTRQAAGDTINRNEI